MTFGHRGKYSGSWLSAFARAILLACLIGTVTIGFMYFVDCSGVISNRKCPL